MALKSSREGLRKELVDYLGNIIIDENLKQNIINSVGDVFINNEELTASVNELDEKIRNETSARESADSSLQSSINLETTERQEAISNIEYLINNGVLKIDLLWTNKNLNSAFVSQDISLDFSKYNAIILVTKYGAYHNWYYTDIIAEKEKSIIIQGLFNFENGRRLFVLYNDKLQVGGGEYRSTYTSNYDKQSDEYIIPYRIYGVRWLWMNFIH